MEQPTEQQCALGVIGLSVMGANLAMNVADHGFRVAVYNRSSDKTEALVKNYTQPSLIPCFTLEELVAALEIPRRILLMVQAGEAVDTVIKQLAPLLAPGDMIIDGGNSFFQDTIRREQALRERGLLFVGMGVSGGEEGARRGPSLMPGGSVTAWTALQPILTAIAAKDFHGGSCVIHIGENGAGHYVKMVHNGIEYIDMQLIAETYAIMKEGFGMTNAAIAETFTRWNEGRLNSFLIEITAKIMRAQDVNDTSVIDTILDSAGSKGTGKWTATEALELGVPSFGIIAAVLARAASTYKEKRGILSQAFEKPSATVAGLTLGELEEALYVSKILAYAQGYELLEKAAAAYGWQLNYQEISRIWEGGCIIRARFLEELERAFSDPVARTSILLSPAFRDVVLGSVPNLRTVATHAIMQGIPLPAFLSGLTYFDSITSARLSANLLQAQRDFFGAHTFQTEIDGPFIHHDWK